VGDLHNTFSCNQIRIILAILTIVLTCFGTALIHSLLVVTIVGVVAKARGCRFSGPASVGIEPTASGDTLTVPTSPIAIALIMQTLGLSLTLFLPVRKCRTLIIAAIVMHCSFVIGVSCLAITWYCCRST